MSFALRVGEYVADWAMEDILLEEVKHRWPMGGNTSYHSLYKKEYEWSELVPP